MTSIEVIAPREDVGRDTISRFDMQFQAAAFAALEILEGKGVDCVYCDYHDDFVVRKTVNGRISYHFFQVKTKEKENHQYNLNEIFGLTAQTMKVSPERLVKVKSSFAGKLLLHGIVFSENCGDVTLLSNVHFEDTVVTAVNELRAKAPKSKAAKFLSTHFAAIFELTDTDEVEPAQVLAKLSLLPAVRYIGRDRSAFTDAARSAVWKYSEIDLTYHEIKEVAEGLVDLVGRKARTRIADMLPKEITSLVGVQLDDLLGALSISRTVYDSLCAGEDGSVLKHASVIQRCYRKMGAEESMIDYAAQQKVNWDIWLRSARHNHKEFDLNILLHRIDSLFNEWERRGADFPLMQELIQQCINEPVVKRFSGLDDSLLFGAMNAVLVRKHSR